MRKWLYIFVLLFATQSMWAEHYGVEHENIFSVRYGGLWQQDEYLSPLLYSGQHIGLSHEWWQALRCDSMARWQHVGKVQTMGGMAYSDARNNLIYSVGLQGGWGALYTWQWKDLGLKAMLGPYLDIDMMGKMHAGNVNKPYSVDLGVNICAMGGVSWCFSAPKTMYRLRYLARVNIVGADYMPDYWQSNYEVAEGILGNVRCAGVWNHRHLQHELTFDMQWKHSTWRLGIVHEYVEYGRSEMMFSRESVSAVVGCIWHYRVRKDFKF